MTYKLIDSKRIFQGKIFNIKQDLVEYPDGRRTRLDILEHHGAVAVMAIDQECRVWMVRQYRHPAGELLLEIPAGGLEAGEDPAECAQRELREETGMRAEKLECIGEFFLAPGYSSEYMYVFLAQDLVEDPLDPDANELLHLEKIMLDDLSSMVKAHEIKDSKTLAAFWLYQQYLVNK